MAMEPERTDAMEAERGPCWGSSRLLDPLLSFFFFFFFLFFVFLFLFWIFFSFSVEGDASVAGWSGATIVGASWPALGMEEAPCSEKSGSSD